MVIADLDSVGGTETSTNTEHTVADSQKTVPCSAFRSVAVDAFRTITGRLDLDIPGGQFDWPDAPVP